MNITEKLDLAIKLKEIGTVDGSYSVSLGDKAIEKQTYMTNGEWAAFLDSMTDSARKEYGEGDGGELEGKNGHPPKMASYGSSSRMIYNLSCEKEGFHFEKKLPTTVGGTANLDGFFEDGDRYIFVEAKCHEPYSVKRNSVSKAYGRLYEYLNERMMGNVRIEMKPSKCGRYLDVEYFSDDEKLGHFDMKQMICHLLGIATGMLKGTLERKQTDFIYLLYDPTELDTGEAKEQIDAIYERTRYECNLVDFSELLRAILEFLKDVKFSDTDADTDEIICKFTFTLASQEFYPVLIK